MEELWTCREFRALFDEQVKALGRGEALPGDEHEDVIAPTIEFQRVESQGPIL